MLGDAGPINRTTTIASLLLIGSLVAVGAMWPDKFAQAVNDFQQQFLYQLKWFLVLVVAFSLAFVIWLGMGRYRNVRLGHDDEVPEFTYRSWFSMLFAAGMGIGLIFWSIAEPLSHFRANPFTVADETAEAAATAMQLTFFHWGLSAWAVYALMALALAYFAFRYDRPLTPRSIIRALVGDRADGVAGHLADLVTVFGAAVGIATSLGLGVQQIEGGLANLFAPDPGMRRELIILAVVTLIATLSAISGVRRGVRVISNFNLILSGLLLGFFLLYGPTRHLLNLFVQTSGAYLQNLPVLSTWTDAHEHSGWQENWTLFYWGWWIAWSPFVGMFIARISRGRTIREFVLGVLLVPTILTFAWLSITGGTALYLELFAGQDLLAALDQDVTLPLYRTIELISPAPVSTFVTALLVLLVASYFVTSCDSGTLVIATVLSNGAEHPPLGLRITWGIAEGAIAAVLLLAGGLAALQTAVIIAGLPVALLLVAIMAALLKGLRNERQAPRPGRLDRSACEPWTGCRNETSSEEVRN